ncbi:MAG: hypothetical protein V2B18_16650 [Pseudomonadota bacterium]
MTVHDLAEAGVGNRGSNLAPDGCEWCGTPFLRTRSRQVYCSLKCNRAAKRHRHRIRTRNEPKELQCPICRTVVVTRRSDQPTCGGNECVRAWRVRRKCENDSEGELWSRSVNQLRALFGLPLLRPGAALCLNCNTPFESWDIGSNRLCDKCRE